MFLECHVCAGRLCVCVSASLHVCLCDVTCGFADLVLPVVDATTPACRGGSGAPLDVAYSGTKQTRKP